MPTDTNGPTGPRRPLTIDLPAEEIGRKPPEHDEAHSAPEAAGSDPAPGEAEARIEEAPAAADCAEPAEEQRVAPAEPAPPARRRASFGSLLAAALLGGLLAAGAMAALDRSGILRFGAAPEQPVAADPAVTADIAALRAEVAELSQAEPPAAFDVAPLQEQIAALEASIAELRQQPAGSPADGAALQEVQTRLAQLEQTAASIGTAEPDAALGARLDELAGQVEALRTAESSAADPTPRIAQLGSRLDALTQRLTTLEARPPVDLSGLEASIADLRGQLATLSQRLESAPTAERIAALETTLADTSQRVERATGLGPAVAAAALAAALESGSPFAAELAALRGLGLNEASLAALEPRAPEGLPTLPELRAQFEEQAAAIDLSMPVPASAGPLDRLLGSARGLVEVRPAKPTGGTDPGAVLARIRGALEAGDLENALAEWNALPEDARAPLAEWARSVEARVTAEKLVAQLRSEALSRLGTEG